MNWKYESDGDPHNKTHYITAENENGKTLKDTFLRIDVPNRNQGLLLANNLNAMIKVCDPFNPAELQELAEREGWI